MGAADCVLWECMWERYCVAREMTDQGKVSDQGRRASEGVSVMVGVV